MLRTLLLSYATRTLSARGLICSPSYTTTCCRAHDAHHIFNSEGRKHGCMTDANTINYRTTNAELDAHFLII